MCFGWVPVYLLVKPLVPQRFLKKILLFVCMQCVEARVLLDDFFNCFSTVLCVCVGGGIPA